MKKITFNVEGMHCSSCEMLVKDSLDEDEGVKNSQVSHKDSIVKVEFDEKKIDESKIKAIIKKEGYEVE